MLNITGMRFFEDVREGYVPEEEDLRESIAEGSEQGNEDVSPQQTNGIEDILLDDVGQNVKKSMLERHIMRDEDGNNFAALSGPGNSLVFPEGVDKRYIPRNSISLESPQGSLEDRIVESLKADLAKNEKNAAVRRAFGPDVSPGEMERVAKTGLPIESLGVERQPDNGAGDPSRSVGNDIGDFYTWLRGTGGRYGDMNDILSANYEQARRDYNDLISPEAKQAREKANESRKRLAALGDIGLVLGDIVGAAAGGNVNRRDKNAQMVNAERELADEAMFRQRESDLLQRYRRAADRQLANARQDYRTALQRYLNEKAIELRYNSPIEQMRWAREYDLKAAKQEEDIRHNKELEKIAQEKARQSGVRADAYASGINGLKRRYLDNTFGVQTTDPEMNVSVSGESFGKYLGSMLGLTGAGYGSSSEEGSILYDWDKLRNETKGLEKGNNNEGIFNALKSLADAGKAVSVKEKKPTPQQIQNYISSLVGLYNEVMSEGFMLHGKKGEALPEETAAFVRRVEDNVIEVMRYIKLAEKENLAAYQRGLESLFGGLPDNGETVDGTL